MEFKVGTKFNSFYGNGTFICEKEIVRLTKHSVFFENGQRESINTVNSGIKSGLYKIIQIMSYPKSPNENWIKETTLLSMKDRDKKRLENLKSEREGKQFRLIKISDYPLTFKEIQII